MNNIDFTCTFEDRQLDRVLFDQIHESVSVCLTNSLFWTYCPTVLECNKVIGYCIDRLSDLETDDKWCNGDLEFKQDMVRLCRNVMRHFVNIQKRLLQAQ